MLELHPGGGVAPHLVQPLLQLPGGLLHPALPPDVDLVAEPVLHHRLVLLRHNLCLDVLRLEAHIAEQFATSLLPPQLEGERCSVLVLPRRLRHGPRGVPAQPAQQGGAGGLQTGGTGVLWAQNTARHIY